MNIPSHLKKYIVKQNYPRYNAIDQAVWRFIMRQLKTYLTKHAHPCYLEGLEKTGIPVETIPKIEDMSKKLSKFGWHAVPVSGFIPPAAFMELQSIGVLPIASDMRAIEHLSYTPAPDIVHEAAGHAPILVQPEFSKYLRSYAEIAKKAIINTKDLKMYETIRVLSDLKENPTATREEISRANTTLFETAKNMGEPSEAALLARMNWWTAEYGLIGDLSHPMIYGAGLLSSVGESKTSLNPDTKKIPFSLDCLKFSYDITEPQPQLFVAESFKKLTADLENYSKTMAYKTGGVLGLEKIKTAHTVNSVQLDSGLQISGILKNYIVEKNDPVYLQFDGPCQLCFEDKQLSNQGKKQHAKGFGCPVGESDLSRQKLSVGKSVKISYKNGVLVKGIFKASTKKNNLTLVITLKNCTVAFKNQVLFKPAWGDYDLVIGSKVISVYGGPTDRVAFGATDDFSAKRVPAKKLGKDQKNLMSLYSAIRKIRLKTKGKKIPVATLKIIIEKLKNHHRNDWLLKLEILELLNAAKQNPEWKSELIRDLQSRGQSSNEPGPSISEGIRISNQLFI